MALRTAGSVLVVFLWSVAVVLSQNGWSVTYTTQSICTLKGSTVEMSCSYTYPSGYIITTTLWFTEMYDVENYVSLLDDPDYKGRVMYRSDKMNGHTLTITDLRERDSATYKFRFITNQTRGKYFGSPGVTLSVTDLQVKVTTTRWSTTLTCSTTCTLTDNPNPTYIWYRNSKIVQKDSSPSYSVYFQTEDSFYCAVKGINSPAVLVLGQDGWSVTYTTQSICTLKGSTVEMSCSYTYPRGYTVTSTFWFTKNDGEGNPVSLSDDADYKARVTYNKDNKNDCTLRITDLRESDSATYKFRFITDQTGGRFTGSPGVTLSVTDLQVKVTPYSVVSAWKTLTCTTCVLTGNPTYIWYKNGQIVTDNTSPYSVLPDAADSYSCAVKGHEGLLSPAVCVQGQSCNRVTYTKRRICVLKGSTVDISCTVGYYYTTSSFWFRSDKSTPEDLTTDPGYAGRVKYTGTHRGPFTLRITDLREEDSAEYRFTFKTDNIEWGHSFPGTTLSVAGLQVKVTPAAEGQKTLTCITTCTLTDNPTYIWYKNGQRVDEPTSQQYSSNTLVVLGHSVDSYSCAVEHHEDLHSPAVYAPKNTSVSVSPSGEIVEGSSVTLTCSSDANPPVDKYTWYKKNVASPKASGQSYSITNISSEGRGEYYCEAENKYGRLNSSSVSVDVQYTTAVFLWVPVMGMGAVLTVGALLLTIYCYMKRRHTGGSDDTADTQSVHPDPNSDMYTSLNMKTRSPEYDTLANVRDFAVTQPSDTC